MLALGRALAGRGHDVTLQTWHRWREAVEREGMRFAPAPEYDVFPSGEAVIDFYGAAHRATLDTLPLVRELEPDVVVADILTLAPGLAGELAGVPVATLVPHVLPWGQDDFPVYSLGARLPRSAAGRKLWRALAPIARRGAEQGRQELNALRSGLGLPSLTHLHGGISRELALIATLPELEYPRGKWPPNANVIGPLMWEPAAAAITPPPGNGPVVLVAPSTAQDREQLLLRSALAALRHIEARVIATYNRRLPAGPLPMAANVRVVDWLSYAKTMPACDVVICHGGHGTLVRALTSGCAVVVWPAAGDMAENAARVDWAGAGVRIPRRLLSPAAVHGALARAIGEPGLRRTAIGIASAQAARPDPAQRGAELVEQLAGPPR